MKFILILNLYIFSTISQAASWKSDSLSVIDFDYLEKRPDGQYQTSIPSYKMAQRCYGFQGSCSFPELGLRLDLTFEGKTIRLPWYSIFNRGLIEYDFYFGTRKLVISKINGNPIATFTQSIWLTSAYSDFSQILYFDLSNKKLIISARDGFYGVKELGYAISY